MSTEQNLGIGGNNPPLKERLELEHAEVFKRLVELEQWAAGVPEKFTDDLTAGNAQDLVKMMRVALKQAKATCEAEREPYQQAVKEINATFKIPMERLEAVMSKIMARHSEFLEEKKAEARRKLEEEARIKREEAERLRKEAELAEARRLQAEMEKADAERKAAEAERQRQAAVEEAARQARLAKEATDETVRQEAINAKLIAQRQADAAIIESLHARNAASEAKAEARSATQDQTISEGQAMRMEKRADRIEVKAEGSDADLSRTRGERGTVGSLAKRWTYRVTDYDALPLELLRPHIARDALDAAVYRLMMTGVREIEGAVIEQVSEARVK